MIVVFFSLFSLMQIFFSFWLKRKKKNPSLRYSSKYLWQRKKKRAFSHTTWDENKDYAVKTLITTKLVCDEFHITQFFFFCQVIFFNCESNEKLNEKENDQNKKNMQNKINNDHCLVEVSLANAFFSRKKLILS